MDAVAVVPMSGSLTRHAEGFAAELRAQGYTEQSVANHLRLLADLSRWLQNHRILVEGMDPALVRRFLAKRRRRCTHFTSERAMAPLLGYLRGVGAVSATEPPERHSGVLGEYERYVVDERGVTPVVRDHYMDVAEEFLRAHHNTSSVSTREVTRYIKRHAGRPGFGGWLSALRSLLRFLFITSKTDTNLVYVVPSAPRWSQRSLPKDLSPRELGDLLSACDRRTTLGCRAYAVLLLLSRLGLRACEVAALQLEDVDWRSGQVTIRGKGKSLARLPLPADVGNALVGWLRRGRRSTTTRSVFVRVRAPYGPLTASAIIVIATTAMRAAGIERGGAHRLRHTAATQMLRRGASMTEIAQVLRHRHLNTTAIYAKVDRDALRTIAKPWPPDHSDPDRVRELARVWPGGVA
jgi:site-specific recombinase XerD